MATVSIIVPVYNAEKFLERCINSILSQTFTDFELILVDDGCTDDSGRICDRYTLIDPRVKVIHQNNQGQAAARNNALIIANCDWIHFVDGDDLIHPQMLELLYNGAVSNNVDISMCGMIESDVIPDNFFENRQSIFTVHEVNEEYIEELYSNGGHRYGVVCAKLIRRHIIEAIPFEKGRIHEDIAVVCRWLHKSHKVANTNDLLYYYQTNPNGTTKSPFSKKNIDNLWAMNETLRFYKNVGYFKMLKRVYIALMNIATTYFNIAKNELYDKSLTKEVQKSMRHTYKEFRKDVDVDDNFNEYICGYMYPKTTTIVCVIKRIFK